MAVHMIRVLTSREGDYSLSEVNTAMDDWIANHSEWVDDPTPHHIQDIQTEGGTPYRAGEYRFLFEDAKDNLLQKCEDKLVNKVAWYRIGYHECQHDEEPPSPCSWGEQREWADTDVAIPDDIPPFV